LLDTASLGLWYSRNTFIQVFERKQNVKVFTEKERISSTHAWFWKTKEIITTRLTGGLHQGYKPKLPASA